MKLGLLAYVAQRSDIAAAFAQVARHGLHYCRLSVWNHALFTEEVAKELAAMAEPLGITCLYEPQGYYMNTVERLSELLATVDAPNVGICMDLSNPLFFDNDPLSFTQKFTREIKHVHIKDCVLKDGAVLRDALDWCRRCYARVWPNA